ncbi:STAS domain-containing protein [Thiorhodococcus minor]|uniref:STAS domain-containing protein n=1 Tax=Thiorhodococcus minor TaxID=57489 RepID=A0A6M0K8W7_9GAMM|nr:STAS domain-containing protein [Thiorhodococcus minor]NEV64875.1 STAS domain-containing protein [Thiorhodococcus minor]
MTIHLEEDGETCRLAIEGEMSIYEAADHKNGLFERLEGCREMVLDLSGVGELDSAGLQLLLMLKREAEAGGKRLQLVNHSQAVYAVLELLKMEQHFGDPMVIPAEWRTP